VAGNAEDVAGSYYTLISYYGISGFCTEISEVNRLSYHQASVPLGTAYACVRLN